MTTLERFYGTYRGFTPTDESAVALGEIQVIFGEEDFRVVIATGLEVVTETIPTSEIREMTEEELRKELIEDAPFDRVSGLWVNELNWRLTILRLDDHPTVCVLAGMSMADEFFGPILLFAPDADDEFEKACELIDRECEMTGVIPLIANDGRAPRDTA